MLVKVRPAPMMRTERRTRTSLTIVKLPAGTLIVSTLPVPALLQAVGIDWLFTALTAAGSVQLALTVMFAAWAVRLVVTKLAALAAASSQRSSTWRVLLEWLGLFFIFDSLEPSVRGTPRGNRCGKAKRWQAAPELAHLSRARTQYALGHLTEQRGGAFRATPSEVAIY